MTRYPATGGRGPLEACDGKEEDSKDEIHQIPVRQGLQREAEDGSHGAWPERHAPRREY